METKCSTSPILLKEHPFTPFEATKKRPEGTKAREIGGKPKLSRNHVEGEHSLSNVIGAELQPGGVLQVFKLELGRPVGVHKRNGGTWGNKQKWQGKKSKGSMRKDPAPQRE